ncbi:hypothetical protein PILCRDRAFT_14203 [Piloderma croceum F 1598]|uniref:Uncharacterized protein n=1 Tax=Piloderma croceum (strain F 1598) TaxID=765440 RepID=A0A0C3F4F5_PILCF|nr:hypothetical protein PILCRDRAFT_14203 [Piloderma croceum F 1598]
MWLSFLSIEVVLVLLTAYKLLSYRNQQSRIIMVLARDSIIYFLVICACLAFILADDFDYVITFEVKIAHPLLQYVHLSQDDIVV